MRWEHGLSNHSTKPSKQSSSITLSLTKTFLNNANYVFKLKLYFNSLFSQESFHELCNKRAIICEGTGYSSNRNPVGMPISKYVGALNVEMHKNTYL